MATSVLLACVVAKLFPDAGWHRYGSVSEAWAVCSFPKWWFSHHPPPTTS